MTEEDDLVVTISGPALSMLLYENTRIHDQIGFFLGEIVVYMTKQVTDSDGGVETIKQHINIKNVVSYPVGKPFFDSVGQIHVEILKSFLNDKLDKVVGWYHYRENHRIVSSFQDCTRHYFLSEFFSNINNSVSEENFIFCILTTSLSNNSGTHKFKQLFQHKKDDKFNPVSLKINNLGADASKSDGSDYKPAPQVSSCNTDAFDHVYDGIKHKLKNTSGVESVTLIQKTAENILTMLIPELTTSDYLVSMLEQRIKFLRNEHFRKLFESSKIELSNQKSEIKNDDVKTEETSEVENPSSPEMYSLSSTQGGLKTSKKTELEENDGRMDQLEQRSSSPIENSEPSRSPTLSASRGNRKTRLDYLTQNSKAKLGTRAASVLLNKCDQEPNVNK